MNLILPGPKLSRDTIQGCVGRGVRELIRRCVGREDEALIAEFMRVYGERLTDCTRPYPGVPEGLAKLQTTNVVASNKPEKMSIEILERLGLARYFKRICGGDTFPRRKPDPMPVRELMKQFGADEESTLLVGDSEVDKETAEKAGVRFCAVTYGYTPKNRLEGSDWMAQTFAAAVKVIEGREPPDLA